MRRVGLLTLCAAFWMGIGPFAMAAEPGSKPPIVGRLHPGSAADPLHAEILHAFRAGMLALGQVEGRTYFIEDRFAESAGREHKLAASLIPSNVAIPVRHVDFVTANFSSPNT